MNEKKRERENASDTHKKTQRQQKHKQILTDQDREKQKTCKKYGHNRVTHFNKNSMPFHNNKTSNMGTVCKKETA
jgi:hypothetical protein